MMVEFVLSGKFASSERETGFDEGFRLGAIFGSHERSSG